MRRLLLPLAILSLVFLHAGYAGATVFHLTAQLDGTQAGTGSPGTGSATLTLDDVMNTLNIQLSYSGLTSNAIAAHIHCCAPPGSNAGIVLPFNTFVTGNTSGSFSNTFTGLTPTLETDIESGGAYINIHTVEFSNGEIRGQIVPEPASLAFLALGLAVMGLTAARRHR